MKRITLWLAVSLTTFTLGVTTTVLYPSRSAPNNLPPPAIKHDAPAARACLPGSSPSVEKFNTPFYFPRGAFYPKPQHGKFHRGVVHDPPEGDG